MEELYKIIKDKNRVILNNIEEKYLTDTLGRLKGKADALVFPISTEEVSGVLKFAYNNKIPVTPRGAGTNLVGSTVPTDGGIVIDLSKMNRILELDKETFTATVEPGVVLKDFQEYVEKEDLFYPPDPGEKTATIGGNISTNAGGMRAVKYGVTRDYVRALEVVLANGQVVNIGKNVIKDSSGLTLKNLIIGSEGTLAVITKCVLKLVPKPKESLSVLVTFESLKAGINKVIEIIKENANPTAIEFVERKVIELGESYLNLKFPRQYGQAYIILTFDGDSIEEINNNINKVKKITSDVLVLDDPKTIETVWKIRGVLVKAVEAVSEQEPVDIVVPINKIADFISYVNEVQEETGVKMISFGHAGDGNVHLCVIRGHRDDETWKKDLHKVMNLIYSKANELGGLPSGEHGIGLTKKPYFIRKDNEINISIMRGIKESLDTRGILNKGKGFS